MNLLVDTHAFLWFHMADPRLSAAAAAEMAMQQNQLLISMASVWEMAIKVSQRKLALPAPLPILVPSLMRQSGMQFLDVRLEHVTQVGTLPFHHKDPFDRMLVAQCLVENIPLVSKDAVLDQYGIQRIW